MSYRAMSWAVEQKVGDINAKTALIVLAYHLNDSTGLCCPSNMTLREEMEVKAEATVRKAINRLESLGLVSVTKIYGEHSNIIRTEYRLMIGVRNDVTEVRNQITEVRNDVTDVHNKITEGTESCNGGVRNDVTCNKEIEQGSKQEIHSTDDVASIEAPRTSDEQALDCLFPVDESLIREAQTVVEDQAPKQTKTTKKRNTHEMPPAKPEGVSDQVWKDWVVYKKKKSKTVNQYMVEKMVRESQKANISLEDFLKLHMASGWVDYKAEYVKPEDRTGLKPNDPSSIDEWTRKNLGKKVNGQTVLLTQEQRIAENNWGFY